MEPKWEPWGTPQGGGGSIKFPLHLAVYLLLIYMQTDAWSLSDNLTHTLLIIVVEFWKFPNQSFAALTYFFRLQEVAPV